MTTKPYVLISVDPNNTPTFKIVQVNSGQTVSEPTSDPSREIIFSQWGNVGVGLDNLSWAAGWEIEVTKASNDVLQYQSGIGFRGPWPSDFGCGIAWQPNKPESLAVRAVWIEDSHSTTGSFEFYVAMVNNTMSPPVHIVLDPTIKNVPK